MNLAFSLRARRWLLAAALATTLAPCRGSGIFVKLDDFAKGPSQDKGYRDWFELRGGFSWQVSGAPQLNVWRASPGPLVLASSSDGVLPVALIKDLLSDSQDIRGLELHVVKTSEGKGGQPIHFAYYRIILENARIASFFLGATDASNVPETQFTIEYDRFRLEYHYEGDKAPKPQQGQLGALGGLVLTGGSSLSPVTAYADFQLQSFTVGGISGLSTNETPSLSTIADLTWPENRVGYRQFQARDDLTRSTNLVYSAYAANPLLLPDENLVIRHVATNTFELAMTPARNTSGETDVIVRASDGVSQTERRFHATVTPGDKVPQISPTLRATRMNANQTLDVLFFIIDSDTPVTNLVLTVTSSNTNLFPQASMVVTTTGEFSRTLTLTPPPGLFGTSTITLSLTDGIFTTSQTFSIAVNSQIVGSPTNITAPIEVLDLLQEGIPTGTLLGTLTVTDPTPGDTHVLTMLDGAEGRFGITNNNQLVVTSGGARLNRETPGFNGLFNVLVMATDQAGNAFTRLLSLSLLNLNDAPQFRIFQDPWFVQPDTATAVPTCVATDEDAGFVYDVRLTLSSTGGSLSVATNLVTTTSITGNGSANVVILAKINPVTTLLNTPGAVMFVPQSGFSGNFTVTLEINDQNSPSTTAIGIDPDYPARSATLVHHGFVLPSNLSVWSLDQHGNDIFDDSLQSSLWGITADRDRDGFANLFEYALGYDNVTRNSGNPLTASTQILPAALPGGGGPFVLAGAGPEAAYNTMAFVVREDPRLLCWVEAANRLTPLPDWSADVAQIALISRQSLGNGFERLTFRDPDPNKPYRVYRLGMSYLPAPVSAQ